MRQNKSLLVVSLMLAGIIALPATAGITLRAGKIPEAQPVQIVSYLSEINEPLQRALLIHNIMSEMPDLRDVAQTTESLKSQKEILGKMHQNMTDCNTKKLGKVFKDPKKVWGKMMSSYEKQRQDFQTQNESKKTDKLTMSLKEKKAIENMGWSISRDIMLDVYQNPEKWGDINKGGAFPLWKDQVVLFEKQWNQFYENLNATYGEPLKGRPAVDEETRHNAQKYNEVLAAHKIYVAQISKGKKPSNPAIARENPPKAPKGLPRWQDIVRLDPLTGKATPELPEPWKQMSNNKSQNNSENGEMSQFFASGNSQNKSDLESEYEMMLAVDSMEKGVAGSSNTQQKMVQSFVEKVTNLGVKTENFDISNRAQYLDVQKQLKELKKEAMKEAYQYVEKLEQQDKESPELVARREQLMAKKQARLSPEAQTAVSNMEGIVQISQMSPAVQQRLVLSALEKDENASVHLTQTNALNIDQLMREQKSTNKIIAESQKQMKTSMEKQREMIPQMKECSF